jgi:ATP-dependent Clp protease protease subunit
MTRSNKEQEAEKKENSLSEKMLKTRTVTLFDAIDAKVAKEFIQSLLLLEADNAKEPIKVLLNSPGGEVTAGFAIYDAIRFIGPEVKIVCTGLCASIATIILTAVPKKNRLSTPNCEFLIHQPLSQGITGRISDIEIASKELAKTKEKLLSILAKETGKTMDQITRDCDRDYWMTAIHAKEYGLVDRIIDKKSDV